MTPIHKNEFYIKCTHNACQLQDKRKKNICVLGSLEFEEFLKNKSICDYQLFQTIHAKIFDPATKKKYRHTLYIALDSIRLKVGNELERFISHRFNQLLEVIKLTDRPKLKQQCIKEAKKLIFEQVHLYDARGGIKLVKSAIQKRAYDIEAATFDLLTSSAMRYKPLQAWQNYVAPCISVAEDITLAYQTSSLVTRFRHATMAEKQKYYDALYEYMDNQDLTPCFLRINALTLGQRQSRSILSVLPLDIYHLIRNILIDMQCALTSGQILFQAGGLF